MEWELLGMETRVMKESEVVYFDDAKESRQSQEQGNFDPQDEILGEEQKNVTAGRMWLQNENRVTLQLMWT